MFRYAACAWDKNDIEAAATARALRDRLLAQSENWQLTVETPGLFVSHTGSALGSGEPYLLNGGSSGVVLGVLFRDSQLCTPQQFDDSEAAKVVTTAGRHLIDRYWGRYVAFIREHETNALHVLRDPSAGLHCFTTQSSRVHVFWSWMEDGVRLDLGPWHINWRYLLATLCYLPLQGHQTGLEEVTQVLAGECLRLHADNSKRTFCWNPLEIAVTRPIEDLTEATSELRRRTEQAVHAWASCYRGALLALSGGLDSSIVLACLREAPSRPRVVCVNYHSPGSDTDERWFARISARSAACELIEKPRNSSLALEPLLQVQRTSVPAHYVYWLENGPTEARLAAECGAGVVLSGYGGDQLFYQGEARWGPSDFLQSRGLRPELFHIVMSASRIDRLSVWAVLRGAIVHGLLRRPYDFFTEVSQFKRILQADVVRSVGRNHDLLHPWLLSMRAAPTGKIFHALQVAIPWEEDPLVEPGHPERIAPLYSQPVLEACMRIPTYLLTWRGWDRAIARRAFQDRVPIEIIQRRTKGGAEEYLKSILRANLPLVRELLLDGELARASVINRAVLDKTLSPDGTGFATGPTELFDYLSTEAWLRRWRASLA